MNANSVKMNINVKILKLQNHCKKTKKKVSEKHVSGAASLTPTGAPVNFAGDQ